MMVVVVPKVTAIFESLDRALPWYTRAPHRRLALHRVEPDARLRRSSMVTFTFDALGAARLQGERAREAHARSSVMALASRRRCSSSCAFVVESLGALRRGRRRRRRRRARRWRGSSRGRDAGRARRQGRLPAQGPGPRVARPHARGRRASRARSRRSPERRAAAQGDGDRQERPRQRASSRRSSRRPPGASARASRSPGRSSAAATSRRS